MTLAETMSNWLRKIERDQNIQGLGQLEDTLQAERGRRWFKRQDLTPTLQTGYYDPATEKFVLGPASASLGDARHIATQTAFTTAAVALFTLTCPANRAYFVRQASFQNANRAGTYNVVYTPNGGTAIFLCETQSAVAPINGTTNVIGGEAVITNYVRGDPLWLQAGDTLTINNVNFVAADDTEYSFLYEEYVV